MIRFFDSHFPSRILFLIVLAASGMVAFQYQEVPVSENILRWMITGEKLWEGNVLYRDIWVSEGPFYSWCSVLVFGIFERSLWAYSSFGMLLILIQAFYFAAILNKVKILKNRTYVFVLVYILFFFFNRNMMGFSPVLLGMTFALMAFRTIVFYQFSESEQGRPLTIGLLLGLSMLSSPVFVYFIPFYLIGMLSLSSLNIRSLLLWISGMILPFALVFVYMYWNSAISEFLRFYIYRFFYFQNTETRNLPITIAIIALPLLLILFGWLKAVGESGTTNFIDKVKQLFTWWMFTSLLVMAGSFQRMNVHMGILLVVPFGYYFTLFISGWKRPALAEFLLLVIIGAMVSGNIYFKNVLYPEVEIADERMVEHKDLFGAESKVFSFRGRVGDYVNVHHGTVFLLPVLQEKYLKKESKKELVTFYELFRTDQPDFVLDDEAGTFKDVLSRIPVLNQSYKLINDGVYQRIEDK